MLKQAHLLHAVIFDVDGTLLDSVDLHAKAWVDAFSDYGHRVSFDDVRRQIGKGGDQLLPVFLSAGEIEASGESLAAHRGDILKRRYMPLMKPFAEVRALLERVRGDGIQVALASSASKEELDSYKKILNIVDLIDVETSADDAEKSKPHPDIFQAVLKRLEPSGPQHMVVIGDTPYDAQAAGNAGIATIGVLCGGWVEDDLRQAGCIAVYKDPADLLASFDRWRHQREH